MYTLSARVQISEGQKNTQAYKSFDLEEQTFQKKLI